jgi:antitoxin ParD1/3/4
MLYRDSRLSKPRLRQPLPFHLSDFVIMGSVVVMLEDDTMATMNVSLPDPMQDWGESRPHDSRFSNAGVFEGYLIRKDQELTAAIATVQAEINGGFASGNQRAVDSAAFRARMREPHHTRLDRGIQAGPEGRR